jgi:REP-associated tyrosine transposase
MFVAGESTHLYSRGNNRIAIFHEDTDRQWFLSLLKCWLQRYHVAAHNFVLMTTHFHLIATPSEQCALSFAMKEILERYSRFFNRKYHRTGALWEGRFRARAIKDEQYALICARYIEQNPVRANMVTSVDAYRWSSYGFLALGHSCDWLVPHPTYLTLGHDNDERRAAYRAICAEPVPVDAFIRLRHR